MSAPSGRAPRVLLAVSGSIAAWKSILLLRLLQEQGIEVRVAMTDAASRFVGEATFHAMSQYPVATDLWDLGQSRGGEPHVELGAWADAIVVYPATANLLGKLAAGQADDVVLLSVLCSRGPVLLCPAMHERMWTNPLVQRAAETLRSAGLRVLPPVRGRLASGEKGEGRLPEPEEALEAVLAMLVPQDLAGRRILVTCGPTREHLDPVRFLSNPSTGRMGDAVARVAARRGAAVDLVRGPTELRPPTSPQIVVHPVVSAEEMKHAVDRFGKDADAVVMSAAVADFRPAVRLDQKVKKGVEDPVLLRPTDDILLGLALSRGEGGRPLLIGFAMETEDLLLHARAKLQKKRLDLIVANDLGEAGAGFAGDTNAVTLLFPDGREERLGLREKVAVAQRICDEIATMLRRSQ